MLLLQEFDFDIQHCPGTHHAVADYLSQIENGDKAIHGYYNFPDRVILHIATSDIECNPTPPEDKWLMEMSVFLYTDVPLPWLRIDEKKRLEVWSCNLCLLEDTLYHKGSDGIWRRCVGSDEK